MKVVPFTLPVCMCNHLPGFGTETPWELIQFTVVAENKPSKEVGDFVSCSELNCHSKGPVSITVSTTEAMAWCGWEWEQE